MKIIVHVLSAFAKGENGGNLAGVVLDQGEISHNEMQKIAKEMGFSETAFFQRTDIADFRLKFFTPNSEVDICGHATIAAFSLIYQLRMIEQGGYHLETNIGILQIDVSAYGAIYMSQHLPSYDLTVSPEVIYKCLNLKKDDLIEGLPIQIVSTGLRDIMVPIKNRGILGKIRPNHEEIKTISQKYDVVGIHAFTLDTNSKYAIAKARNFAPLYGIEEEPATGTSNAALACYLHYYNELEDVKELKIEQGDYMEMPSEILVKLDIENKSIIGVKIGGIAKIREVKVLDI